MYLTEALVYYNMEQAPSVAWMRANFTHFFPSPEDAKAREEYQKRIQEGKKEHGKKRKKIFE